MAAVDTFIGSVVYSTKYIGGFASAFIANYGCFFRMLSPWTKNFPFACSYHGLWTIGHGFSSPLSLKSFYEAKNTSLYCINHNGNIVWRSAWLGVDGVIVHDIEVNKIYGSGEWDPLGGWRKFELDKHTGALLTEL